MVMTFEGGLLHLPLVVTPYRTDLIFIHVC
jgi:hypothetical protein